MVRRHQTGPKAVRSGIVDIWNAFMLEGASYAEHDIPICPTTARSYPSRLVSWPEAKRLHKKALRRGDKEYKINAYVHFYVDDAKFDGIKSSIWLFPWKAEKIIRHFAGMITPDFSTCQDFPEPIKLFATYRMRAFGYWMGTLGIEVINNVRWGSRETWDYCFAGIEKHTIVAVGAIASGLRKVVNRPLFEDGLVEMAARLKPTALVVYGSANYSCFNDLAERGITVIQFDSETSQAYAGVMRHVQD